ncbi:leucyl/phenylalanyl-tRNA--protein transferase [Marinospirillum insulare]|uniref:Leucyl/phenylalanyl-tRNA--protein transferase n=1 Tax=Marinospirillum insulare TaxID=217169 RepID=A0ABQ5ZVS1_9GAMM|nr:leucyl/phenylalanyl-tRNA--protein transferase [Marinospirillum insulare]GLR63117.1 leucyl/phenylalanyl-tRNA--protein transferase [Marinospirillum insulare]
MLEIWQLDKELWFPSPNLALQEPNGLLAFGGDLSAERLLLAYQQGIFPWFNEGEPPLWWSPAPRMVLYPEEIRISRSLNKRLKRQEFQLSFDTCFAEVINQCAISRQATSGTWITSEMQTAYTQLHQQGYAHSVEVWQQGHLVGGLYGLALGGMFFGESMFSHVSDASKVALVELSWHLKQQGFSLIDCQVYSNHLASLGAKEISRELFLHTLAKASRAEVSFL